MFCQPCSVMLVGTALYVRLMVYVGLSLFIISRLYIYMVVCVIYAYNLTWGGLKNGKNGGEPKWVLSHFCHVIKKGHGHFRIAPLSFNCSGDFLLILPCLFTVHVRPVLSPCQAGNTCYTSTCFSNIFKSYIDVNTIYSLI